MIDGYLSASFDLLNVADLDVIDQARDQCDRLIVGLFSDEYVERTIGRRPVIALAERAALLSHVRGVDQVVVHDDVDLTRFGDGAAIFAVEGVCYAEQPDDRNALWLRPRRQTESAALRSNSASTTTTDQSAVA